MANQLQMFYNTFEGIDTRTNKLRQNPGSFRKGSKNFRYNFQDEIQNAQGFQHKDSGAPAFVDIFEYRYRDLNTGISKSQSLGVSTAGELWRKREHRLNITPIANSNYSIFYDELLRAFKITVKGQGSVLITDTMTLTQLATALAGIGVTADVRDESNNVVSSTNLAYLLNCTFEDSSFAQNPVYFWEKVPFPNSAAVPFPTTA
ncbi:MAG TPA: hypothetical protein DCE71_00240, partial [Parachlamydiales bacterium]|nr:hypothetical protein [Parachlamydiales bacterium]